MISNDISQSVDDIGSAAIASRYMSSSNEEKNSEGFFLHVTPEIKNRWEEMVYERNSKHSNAARALLSFFLCDAGEAMQSLIIGGVVPTDDMIKEALLEMKVRRQRMKSAKRSVPGD